MKKHVLLPILSLTLILASTNLVSAGEASAPIKNATQANVAQTEPKRMANVKKEMMTPSYWINNTENPNDIIMTQAQIDEFNKNIYTTLPDDMFNFSDRLRFSTIMSKEAVTKEIQTEFDTDESYINDTPITQAFKDSVTKNINLQAMAENISLRFGFFVNRSNVKFFPIEEAITPTKGDLGDDLYQNSAALPNEPFIIMHESLDRQWYFGATNNCHGWVKASDVGLCKTREEFDKLRNPSSFLVVTGDAIQLDQNPYNPKVSENKFQMGTILPLASEGEVPSELDGRIPMYNYVVKVPVREDDGTLRMDLAFVPSSRDVSVGFLPYTSANLIEQSFKTFGNRYGWGGMLGTRDCSQYILEIYRCFGFNFPRNSEPQIKVPGITLDVASKSDTEKKYDFDKLQPGALLYFPGQIAFYLGAVDGNHYAISSVGAYALLDTAGKPYIQNVNTTIINSLEDTFRMSGKSWLTSITNSTQVRQP